ncbi:MAG: hypothetical protein JWO10_772 [Microbacteriaceae bacterium]|nr:hypothetical protein [Microbacteriaceae bacterium]
MSAIAPNDGVRQELSPARIRLIIGGLMAGVALSSLDHQIIATALPTVVGDLGGLDQISWVITAYLLASTAVTPLYGKISDILGRRPVFLTAIIIFLIGSMGAGLAQNMTQLIVLRAIQGVGGGGLISLAQTVIGDISTPRDRAKYQGYIGVVVATCSVLGPALGGVITDLASWRWVFFINVPVGIVALVTVSSVLKYVPQQRVQRSIDYLGSILLVVAIVAFVLGLFRGPKQGWDDPVTMALIGGGLLVGVLFVIRQRVAPEPIMSLNLFRIPNFRWATVAAFAVGFASTGVTLYFPLLLQAVKGLSASQSGLAFIPETFALMAMNIIGGRIISRTGRYKYVLVSGLVLLTASLTLLALLPVAAPVPVYVLGTVLFGLGIGCTTPVLMLIVQNSVDSTQIGVGTGTVTFSRAVGGTLGAAAVGTVVSSAMVMLAGANAKFIDRSPAEIWNLPTAQRDGIIESLHISIGFAFAICIPLAIASVFFALLIKEVTLRTSKREPDPILMDIPIAGVAVVPEPPMIVRVRWYRNLRKPRA